MIKDILIIIIITILIFFIKFLSLILPLLIAVAYFTIAERKLIGTIQRRKGPNVVGFLGLMQPLSDGLKLFVKETIVPTNSVISIFLLAPLLTFLLSLINWAVVPLSSKTVIADINLGILYLLSVSSVNVYGIIIAGWSSNSKYSFLGTLRSTAQIISYEISLSFIILTFCSCIGSLNLTNVINFQKEIWLIFPLLPLYFVFCTIMLAETNRHPFDLPEAEAELVSGYNVEYSSMTFAFFFLGEYANMLTMSAFMVILFFGGWTLPYPFNLLNNYEYLESFLFSLKLLIGVVFFIVTRAALPRYRYDQLMYLGWKNLLPFCIGYLLFTVGLLKSFQWLPI
jgi:NADH-quinone oxidoreductase subunit H